MRPSKIAFMAQHAWNDAAKGEWPPAFPTDRRKAYELAGDPALAGGVPAPLLRLQPVQALGDAERAEGLGRRIAVAARRLARAIGCERCGVARGSRTERADLIGAVDRHGDDRMSAGDGAGGGEEARVVNGLYIFDIEMRDGKRGQARGVVMLCDGRIMGGDSYFYYTRQLHVSERQVAGRHDRQPAHRSRRQSTRIRRPRGHLRFPRATIPPVVPRSKAWRWSARPP